MIKRCSLLLIASLAILGCASQESTKPGLSVSFSEPTEADAVPMTTKYHTKDEVKANLGEPKRIARLTADVGKACEERWFYVGKVNVSGLGPIDLMTYVDFDSAGKVCESKART
jgi:hypothetical protein